jgi:hypothetical protein
VQGPLPSQHPPLSQQVFSAQHRLAQVEASETVATPSDGKQQQSGHSHVSQTHPDPGVRPSQQSPEGQQDLLEQHAPVQPTSAEGLPLINANEAADPRRRTAQEPRNNLTMRISPKQKTKEKSYLRRSAGEINTVCFGTGERAALE